MLFRPLLVLLPWAALAPLAHAQSAGPQIDFHVRMVKVDPAAEAAIWPYLRSAAATDGFSVVRLAPGVTPAELLQAAGAAGRLDTLAEPNLLSNAGREATFLAGSTFPMPRRDPVSDRVSVDYQQYGIRLEFLPTVNTAGIGLRVATESSFLDFKNAVTVNGFTVPAITRRKGETHLDLANGQSFVISGMVDREMVESISRIPGVADIPLLREVAASGGAKVLVLVSAEIAGR